MRHLNKRPFLFGICSLFAAFLPSSAVAHPVLTTSNAFAGGFFHSFTGLDHALAMIGVGVLSTKLLRSDVLLLPLTFLIFLAWGAGLGYFGFQLRFAETAIAMSCIVLGSCILSSRLQKYRRSIFGIVAGFATVHGYVHLIELPAGFSTSQFTFGFISASAIMHITGVFIGEAFKDKVHLWLMQIFGSAMIVFGVLFFIHRLHFERRFGLN
jgi:urease accessory protein